MTLDFGPDRTRTEFTDAGRKRKDYLPLANGPSRPEVRDVGFALPPLEQPAHPPPRADFVEPLDPLGQHPPHRVLPPHRREHLLYQQTLDLGRIGMRTRVHVRPD